MRGLASSSRKSGTVRKALAMCLVAGVSLLNVTVAGAEDIHVIATGALQGAMKAIKPAYERKTGNRLLIVYGPSFGASPESIPERLKAGEPMDVTVVSEDALKSLMTDGRFDPASKRVVAISRIGVAVPAGKARPDISTVDAFRAALLAAPRVAYSQGASGVYISGTLLDRLGIAAQVKSKAVVAAGKELVGDLLARGEADIGMQQVSELKVTPGVEFLGPLPEEIQKVTSFAGAVASRSRHRAKARAFLTFLASPEARPLLEASGLENAKPSGERR